MPVLLGDKSYVRTNVDVRWERGTVENTNGLLRQFFPKGCNLCEVTTKDVQQIENLLNSKPRKTLNYYTPEEINFWRAFKEGLII